MKKININNKYHNYLLFLEDKELENNVPETKKLTKQNLLYLINKYKKVVIKPTVGSHGNGIIFVTKVGIEDFEVQILDKKIYINGQTKLYNIIEKHRQNIIPKIIQKYIPLASFEKRPIDFRYILQKNNSNWMLTGMYAKVAKEGFHVTNFKHGASIYTVSDAIKLSNIRKPLNELLLTLESVALSIPKSLHTFFPYQNIWGCDLGLDENGKVWIIETNSAPQTKGFLELDSLKEMYDIIEYYKLKNKVKK
ncbi:YheC/YheD family protein [Metabacillus halosaccharovorans]|uniref:YheC/YheD family protein n=1 Tax=Metabacillus halosaccharovorans TaxID=930124 RepID=UPI001C2014F3|nr:YheC/YheD family protein [Metabacillus halosaccharovorans]MBU7592268.1 hypothetical protein [Metabacillus halosaccharovorans]